MSDMTEELIRETIQNAAEVSHPLEDLLTRVEANPSAPLAPEMLKHLATLRKEDPVQFKRMRAQFKHAGCWVTVLDKVLAGETSEENGRRPKQADILLNLAQEVDLFHAPDGTAFADLRVNGHRETWPVRSKGLRRWLTKRFFEATDGAPNSEALNSALNVIEAKAHFDGLERQVHIRIGGLDARLYLDLGDERWQAVEIDADGWQIVDNPPVRFRRTAGMLPLPIPAQNGSVNVLRTFLNTQNNRDFILAVAWMLAVLRDRGPYPILVLSGEQGSAKSTFSAILRLMLDPNTAPLRALPKDDRDLFIAANNGHILAFDNLSKLPLGISDTLCRLATGGGFAVRQLYTDQDEVLFDATRPIILNGIEDIVTRPDLADRAIFLTLEPITEERRRPEKDLWEEFNLERPQILGALLDAVSFGLKQLPDTRLEKLPRMADFVLWVTACEPVLWPTGTFRDAYAGNLDEAVDSVIEADPVGSAIRLMIDTQTEWTGTASELLCVLDEKMGDPVRKTKTWPSSARALSGRLRRAATFLRKVGINVAFERKGRSRTRLIHITSKPENAGSVSSRPSPTSASSSKPP